VRGSKELYIDYNRSVRRLLALSLLLLLSFPLAAPLFALSANSEANLPACCRRNGAHHCAMKMQRTGTAAQQTTAFSTPMKCPFYPGAATLVRHNDARLHSVAGLLIETVDDPVIKLTSYTHVRIDLDTAWQKRGPPAPTA
jgi:hypothetical protein